MFCNSWFGGTATPHESKNRLQKTPFNIYISTMFCGGGALPRTPLKALRAFGARGLILII